MANQTSGRLAVHHHAELCILRRVWVWTLDMNHVAMNTCPGKATSKLKGPAWNSFSARSNSSRPDVDLEGQRLLPTGCVGPAYSQHRGCTARLPVPDARIQICVLARDCDPGSLCGLSAAMLQTRSSSGSSRRPESSPRTDSGFWPIQPRRHTALRQPFGPSSSGLDLHASSGLGLDALHSLPEECWMHLGRVQTSTGAYGRLWT